METRFKIKIDYVTQLGMLIAIPFILLQSGRYIFRMEWLESKWIDSATLSLGAVVYIYYASSRKLTIQNFKIRFTFSFMSFVISFLLITLFTIFIHNILDKDYKVYLSDNRLNRIEEKFQEIEREQKVEIERSNVIEERQKLIDSYSTISLIKSIPVSLLVIGLFSLLPAALVRRYT